MWSSTHLVEWREAFGGQGEQGVEHKCLHRPLGLSTSERGDFGELYQADTFTNDIQIPRRGDLRNEKLCIQKVVQTR